MKPGGPLKRKTPLAPVSKNTDRRRRLKARRDHQYGRTPDGRDFAAYVRSFPCIERAFDGANCEGPVEACHLVSRGADPGRSGVGNLWPGCSYHHRRQRLIPRAYRAAEAERLGREWDQLDPQREE